MTPRILERSEHPISRRDIDANVLKVLYRLVNAGHVAYLVGGGVRDLLLGRRPKDFDVATSAHPQQVRDLFRNSRLIGRRFRLVHVFFGPQNVEVATFRRRSEDIIEDGDPLIRRDNTFGTPEEDAFRRDFTVNALFYDIRTFRVIDYVGGVEDLKARTLRTIGDPEIRLREDPVRMLRAARLCARFDFTMEPQIEAAILHHREDLRRAAPARLVEETYRTLGASGASAALKLAARLGLLDFMLPRLAKYLHDRGAAAESRTAANLASLERAIGAGAAANHALALAALFADLYLDDAAMRTPAGARELMTDLRMRGFARADTEQMRFILGAFPGLLNPGRRTLRLARRPYFGQAREFHTLMAANYGADPAALERFLTAIQHHVAERSGSATRDPRRRRRRRWRRRQGYGAASAPSDNGVSNPSAPAGPGSQAADPAGAVHAAPADPGPARSP